MAELSKEACPYCGKSIEVPYGYNVPCPECGGSLNVKREPSSAPGRIGHSGPVTVHQGRTIRPLTPANYRPSGETLHVGQTGSRVSSTGITYADIGGLDDVIEELDMLVNGPVKYPEVWKQLGAKRTRALLLTGPPGCGKTLLVQALATETRRKCQVVQGAEIKGWLQGASEGNLIAAYNSVKPDGILVIDEVDAIGGKRDTMVNETNISIVSTLCSIMDGAQRSDKVTIIGTTNKPHMLDSALRRPGRFDLEFHVPPPSEAGRQDILAIHTRGMPLADNVDLSDIAKSSHGFTGADIAGVCSKVSQMLMRRAAQQLRDGMSSADVVSSLAITHSEFAAIVAETLPSLIREGYIQADEVHWSDVGGLEGVKKDLLQTIVWPLEHKDMLKQLNLRRLRGMLLYGPPGCGKTLLGKAVATESGYNFLAVNGPALLSKWMGSTEEAIRDLFNKARLAAPCIVFLDELESVAPTRGRGINTAMDRAVSQLLAELDGVRATADIFVIGATNRPELVDPAFLRPGRLDLQFEVPPPDLEARREILTIHLKGTPTTEGVSPEHLAEITEGFSGAMLELVCTEAKRLVMESGLRQGKSAGELVVSQRDLLQSVSQLADRAF